MAPEMGVLDRLRIRLLWAAFQINWVLGNRTELERRVFFCRQHYLVYIRDIFLKPLLERGALWCHRYFSEGPG